MIRVDFRLDGQDLDDLRTVAAAELRWMPLAAVCRMAIVEWIEFRKSNTTDAVDVPPLRAASSGVERRGDPLPLLDPRSSEEDQKKKEEKTVCVPPLRAASSGVERRPAHKRSRQTSLIEDEATAVSRRLCDLLSQLKGTTYKTDGPGFAEIARQVRGHLASGVTEADIMAAARHRFEVWGSDPRMRQHCNPTTITRPSNLAGYIAEAKASAPTSASGERPKLTPEQIEEHIKRMEALELPKERWG